MAERYLRKQLAAAGVRLFLQQHVVSVELRHRAPNTIAALITNATRFVGDVFVDASYEADLLPLAGVSHRAGREAASEYNESIGGVYTTSIIRGEGCHCGISPWVDARNKTLIASLQPGPLGESGAADAKIQAYVSSQAICRCL